MDFLTPHVDIDQHTASFSLPPAQPLCSCTLSPALLELCTQSSETAVKFAPRLTLTFSPTSSALLSSLQTSTPLLYKLLKRLLATSHIIFPSFSSSTVPTITIRLPLPQNIFPTKSPVPYLTLALTSLLPSPSPFTYYQITPSTMITFLTSPPPPTLPPPPPPSGATLNTTWTRICDLLTLHHTTSLPPSPTILTGPPGVGKTYSIKASIKLFHDRFPQAPPVDLVTIHGADVIFDDPDDNKSPSEILTKLFSPKSTANTTTLIFVDEADALLSHSPAVTATVASLLDTLPPLVLILATNHIEAIPMVLRRPGRIDKEIYVAPPAAEARKELLR